VLLDVEGATTCSPISRVLCPSFCSFAEPFHCISVKVLRVRHTATPAERVRLVVTLSEGGGTLGYVAVSLDARVWRCPRGRCAAYSF
jgi:hypothetical protein